jgi:thiol-disulfide isomerase/thioredoxin
VSGPPAPIRAALSAAAVAVVAAAMAGCAGGDIGAGPAGSSGQSFVSHSYESTFYVAGHRPTAPAVAGSTISGQKLSLASYHGHTVVLNFWGSWCAPCRAEAPALGQLARNLASKGVRFVGIDIRDQPDSARAFMQTFNVGYPSLNDPGDAIALEFHSTVPPAAIPTTLIIDRTGRIAARVFGASSYAQLQALISKVIGQRA